MPYPPARSTGQGDASPPPRTFDRGHAFCRRRVAHDERPHTYRGFLMREQYVEFFADPLDTTVWLIRHETVP
jgi:hypothetical protein